MTIASQWVSRSTSIYVAVAIGSSAWAQSNEWLYAVRLQSGCCQVLDRLDATTGVATANWPYSGSGIFPNGLTYRTDRLISSNQLPNPDTLLIYHPADAIRSEPGTTGSNWNGTGVGLESHPQTGVIYFSLGYNLYTLSPANGAATLVAPYSGFSFPGDWINSIAIDANGIALAIGSDDGSTRHPVYHVDLGTAGLTWIADLIIPNGNGYYRDLAFSRTGELWASFDDNGINPAARGLYKIDLNSFAVTLVRPMTDPYWGLAFVPMTQQASYCTGKVNSLGCTPLISADGFPSPTAASGYTIRATQVRNQTAGTLVWGLNGRVANPFGGGTLCVAPPWRRTAVQASAGSPPSVADCSGDWQLDFNTWMNHNLAVPAGTTVQVQWLGRDGGFTAPNNWTLSNALEFVMRL